MTANFPDRKVEHTYYVQACNGFYVSDFYVKEYTIGADSNLNAVTVKHVELKQGNFQLAKRIPEDYLSFRRVGDIIARTLAKEVNGRVIVRSEVTEYSEF